ncbi:hypothetical protein OK349_04460 [Sphingomonas sp. BT-65]|uniref:hypothetical protein n=1 Tax=Sphingomonas sp. BT-65 TaxID=2989821 RepID=UPI002235512A|nr:hypothetical protein [Sphingomonas sp. BT-65]MCW4460948.1 hypothetical protein [Sphingomonas sp. BT-65]
MTRPTDIRVDRLVLPASERHRAEAFRTALEQGLAARLGGAPQPAGGDHPLAARTAQAIARRIQGGGA